MVNPDPYYAEARARLGIGPASIVSGLLMWHAGELRGARRELEARTLERSARLLAGLRSARPITIDSTAVLVEETRTPGPASWSRHAAPWGGIGR